MRTNVFRILFFLMAAMIFGVSANHAQTTQHALARVSKIYIDQIVNSKDEWKIEPLLKAELERRGFEIVENRSDADATMSGEIQARIVADAYKHVPHRSAYLFRLTAPKNAVIWRAMVEFASRKASADDNKLAARMIADRLAKEKQKSLK